MKIEKNKKGFSGWKAEDLPKHDIWQIFSQCQEKHHKNGTPLSKKNVQLLMCRHVR
jgi:hypothetical protein